jgi:hypothetical protein
MAAIRAVLIAIIIFAMAVTPLVAPAFGGSSSDDATAYAAFAGGVTSKDPVLSPMQDNDNDDDDDDDDNDDDDNDDDDNDDDDNHDDDDDDNDNNDDDDNDNNDDDGDDNDNSDDNDNVHVIVRTPDESVNRPTKCFDTREVGVVQLGSGNYDVTVSIMPHSSFNQTTRLTLKSVDPASVSAPTTGGMIEDAVFSLDAQSSCDGAALAPLPNLVNLGIVYNTTPSVDKSKLQIVRWSGSAWTNIDTTPDPVAGNPYVSATISEPGTYALIQKP